MDKKILLISGCYYGQNRGGAEYQQFLIGTRLKEMHYEIYYLFIDNGDPIRLDNHFKLIKIKKRSLLRKLGNRYFFLDALKVYRQIKKLHPDIILIRGGFAYVGIAARYGIKHQSKVIWHIASEKDLKPFAFHFGRSVLFDYLDKKILEYGIKKSKYIIGQTLTQDHLLLQNYGKKCDIIVPNFHPKPSQEINKDLPIQVLWIANFNRFKQPELFIKLASRLKDNKNVKFIMIGRNGAGSWQQKITSEIIQSGHIEYKGELPLEEVNDFLNKGHILVNTSTLEGLPNTFIQAWMRKVPVVSLNVDPDNIIKNNGIGFCPGGFQQMVEDVQALISRHELRKNMGEKAQAFSFKNFSMENLDRIVKLIEK